MLEVIVCHVTEVIDHPESPNLTINTVVTKNGSFWVVSNRKELPNGDIVARYDVGDMVYYIPETAIVPEYILKQGYWDDVKNKGILAGSKGNRVKGRKIANILSEGLIFPVSSISGEETATQYFVRNEQTDSIKVVKFGDDVAEFLGITEWVQ